jgi:hypothetical protein
MSYVLTGAIGWRSLAFGSLDAGGSASTGGEAVPKRGGTTYRMKGKTACREQQERGCDVADRDVGGQREGMLIWKETPPEMV